MNTIGILIVISGAAVFVSALLAASAACFAALRMAEFGRASASMSSSIVKLCDTMQDGYAAIAPVRELQEGSRKVAEQLAARIVEVNESINLFRETLYRGTPQRRAERRVPVSMPSESDEAIAESFRGIAGGEI